MWPEIERNTLYDEVWRIPMIEIGKKYGLSRATIKWACQEMGIPRPPQAYWTHLARGLVIATAPPLPSRSPRHKISWQELRQREPKKRKRSPSDARKEAERKLLYEEAVKREELVAEVESWLQAESIRRYLAELDRRIAEGCTPFKGYSEWRAMAERYVSELDKSDLRVR